MDREQWRPFLKRWSEEWIAGHDPEQDRPLDEEVVRDGWLGFAPASDADVAVAEARLGRRLPPSLREFLLATDGWRDAGPFVYRLAGTRGLDWLAASDEAGWIDAYSGDDVEEGEPDEGAILARSLKLSLEGDACVMLLDPEDVDERGEWAAYWLSSWSGMGPERHDSFHSLMRGEFASFHALRQPPGATRDHWDARVEEARGAALGGAVDEPLAVLAEAAEYGRRRAQLLRFQLLVLLGDWHTLSPYTLISSYVDAGNEPLFGPELLPLLFTENARGPWGRPNPALTSLEESGPESVRALVADHRRRLREPGFPFPYGNPEFDAAVRRVTARLADAPEDEEARRRLEDTLWPELKEAMRAWRPLNDDHLAPAVLLADPLLAGLITPERGRELLSVPRGGGRAKG
ncbi:MULTISPECIES: SMI1/KNR4 family protein [Streptomyces]|uniref:SMI1/KNR4 family protein n=1 Tax=Streptomyces TaxID=1883 RepID=UPI00163D070F|nr:MULTISPECIES: SMI1/KNR4 family protein [Streptomyces]MBC2878954.1 SMI1/KNR4 family protein [Streptomyces sp. TYQ1024]UBI40695.1 SMI1/KNR4 family protein [Streptomyces mobaraensis]UKW33277.1 SMI1/KNR4 family protein [Streptomyces sp. TYQ1024]